LDVVQRFSGRARCGIDRAGDARMRPYFVLGLLILVSCQGDDDGPSTISGTGGSGGHVAGTTTSAAGSGGSGGDLPFSPVPHCGTTHPVPLLDLDGSDQAFEARWHGGRLLLWGTEIGGLWSVGPCGENPVLLAHGDARPLPATGATPAQKVLACIPGAGGPALAELETQGGAPPRIILEGCEQPTLTPAGLLLRHDVVPDENPIVNIRAPGKLTRVVDPHDPSAPLVEVAADVRIFDVVGGAWIAAVREDHTLWIYDLQGAAPPRELAPSVVRLLPSSSLPRLAFQIHDGNDYGPILVVDVVTEEATLVTYAWSPLAPPYEEWAASSDGRAFTMVDEFQQLYEAFSFDPVEVLTPPPSAHAAVSVHSGELALPDGSFWFAAVDGQAHTLATWAPLGGAITELVNVGAPGSSRGRSDPWIYALVQADPYVPEGALYITSHEGPAVDTPSVERFGLAHAIGPEGVGLHVLDVDPADDHGTLFATEIATARSFVVSENVSRLSSLRRAGHLGLFENRGSDGIARIRAIAVPGATER
jgi:hypothetical protein